MQGACHSKYRSRGHGRRSCRARNSNVHLVRNSESVCTRVSINTMRKPRERSRVCVRVCVALSVCRPRAVQLARSAVINWSCGPALARASTEPLLRVPARPASLDPAPSRSSGIVVSVVVAQQNRATAQSIRVKVST